MGSVTISIHAEFLSYLERKTNQFEITFKLLLCVKVIPLKLFSLQSFLENRLD